MSRQIRILLLFTCLMLTFMAGCRRSGSSNGAAQSVESYLQALVERDINRMVTASCASWEPQARLEFNSFTAVKLTLQDLDCSENEKSGDHTLVTCNGSIVANYGAEQLEIDIAERTFQVLEEGGDWRMCGYASP
jgi:hypothetical protein